MATSPRTGSYFLSDLIANTGKLGRPKEYFNPFIRMARLGVESEVDGAEAGLVSWRCGLVDRIGTTPNGVACFKLFPDHFEWMLRGVRLTDWFPTIRWIHLTRDDKIGQAISWAIAKETKVWSGRRGNADPEPTYSAESIELTLLDILQDEAHWSAYFLRNRIEPLLLRYEDLERDGAAAVMSIAAYLGVELDREPDLGTTLVKQRTSLAEEWRERFFAEAGSLDRLDAAFRRQYAPRTLKTLRTLLAGRLLVGPIPWRFRQDLDG